MRTSIDIPDELFKKAKITAAEQGMTLRQLVLQGLQKRINEVNIKPDADRLSQIPRGNRKPYSLSSEQIHDLLMAEEIARYGSSS